MKCLSVAFMAALMLSQLSFSMAVEVDDSLILYLSFDEEPEEEVKDLSEYGNNGQIRGETEWVDGKFGKALWLAGGADDYVLVPDSESLRVDEAVTVMAWIIAERHTYPGSDWQGILAKGNLPRSYSLYTDVNKGLHFSTSGATPEPYYGSASTTKVPLDEWVHVAAVAETSKDGGWHRYYINGVPAGEKLFPNFKELPGDTSPDDVGIGRKGSGTCFLGTLDEVRIWNRALSPEEIMEHMNMGRVDFLSVQPQSNLTSTWGHIKVSTSTH